MTCASCAARIEKQLNRLDGVDRHGQLRDREGQGRFDADVAVDDLIAAVEAAGYTASAGRPAPEPTQTPAPSTGPSRPSHCAPGVIVSPPCWPCRWSRWRWSRPCSSTTGSGCRSRWPPRSSSGAAWPFHRAAWSNLRHGAATMDTLISIGTLAAFGWSLYALFFGDAGHDRHDACRSS